VKTRKLVAAISAVLVGTAMLSGAAFAAKGSPGPPDGGGEDPSAVNHLSYPALLIPGVSVAPFFTVVEGALGETYSYGCAEEQIVYVSGTKFTYPNTTCAVLDDQGLATEWLDAAACTASGAPCEGLPVDRVYWQKEEQNLWSGQVTGISTGLPVTIRYVDWGDSIESVTWNETSKLRVETQPFADLSIDVRTELPSKAQLGFQMWHSQGQGINEQWGVRTTEVESAQGLPYAYQSPYAIVNAGTATLYLSKLSPQSAAEMGGCPGPSGGTYPSDYPFARTWTGSGWSDSCNLPPVAHTVELSVSGKYVHGYNWDMKALANPLPPTLCGSTPVYSETGWWRLTFVPNGGATKMAFLESTGTSAPVSPVATPTDLNALAADTIEPLVETEGPLYSPKVDATNNLTYIDLCIAPKTKGGGGGKGGR
jgi:hypothetical protein